MALFNSILCASCENEAEVIAKRLVGSAEDVPTELSDPRRRPGRTLSPDLCAFFGPQLGHDFRDVRIHTNEDASEAARRMGALAFTVGLDIVFAAGRFAPGTPEGLRLLAHELVHVVQQGCVPRQGQGAHAVHGRAPLCTQRRVNPQSIYDEVCPPGSIAKSFPSSSPIGTAYGKYLGLMYVKERKPNPYCIVDFCVFFRGEWGLATIFNLFRGSMDLGVSLAFTNRNVDSTWRWPLRTDILDAERDEVYEIKPIASRDEGVTQLQEYIDQLNLTATVTGPSDPSPRSRVWTGGIWDPSRYPLMIPGAAGHTCLIHAWADPIVPGLLVYDIVCCLSEDSIAVQAEIALTKVKQVSKPILDSQPLFAAELGKTLKEHLPKAPKGSSYAFLVPPRVFETFVIAPLDEELARKYARIYSPRPGPVMEAFILELFVAGHVLTGLVADAAYITGGYMRTEDIAKLWGAQAAIVAGATAAFATGYLLVGGAIGVAAAASPEVAAVAAGVVAAESAGTVLATTELLTVATVVPAAASPVVVGGVGLAAGEAVATGSTLPAWLISSIGGGVGPGAGTGLGVVGVIVTAFLAGDAQAETVPSQPPAGQIAGADPLYLAPIELLAPKGDEITLDAEVIFGGERYFIVGFGGPEEGV